MKDKAVSAALLGLLLNFLGPISKAAQGKSKKKILDEVSKRRYALIVFLENFITQVVANIFEISVIRFDDVRSRLAAKLKDKKWRAKKGLEYVALGEKVLFILHNWTDIGGSSYVLNEELFFGLLETEIPELLAAVAEIFREEGEVTLSKQLESLVHQWRLVFHA